MVLRILVVSTISAMFGLANVCSAVGITGAQIPNKTINTVICVSPAGLDHNPGTRRRPLRTLSRATKIAIAKSDAGKSVKICLAPGIYRESVDIHSSSSKPTALIIYEAVKNGTAIISGADKWTGRWVKYKDSGIYSHKWNATWGLGPDIWAEYAKNAPHASMSPIVRRREIVFANGVSQKQTLTADSLSPGSFCIQENKKRILLYPAPGCSPNGSDIEVGRRPFLFSVVGRNNIVLRGLAFTRSANYITRGAVRFRRANNVLIENCRFEWNNGDGLSFNECNSVTLRNVNASHNGMSGIVYYQGKNLIIQDLTTDYNNWRGSAGGFDYWATAGMKALRIHGAVIRNYSTKYNTTVGLWFDWDNRDIAIENLFSKSNTRTGLMLEACQGPVEIRNSRIFENERGVYIASSDHVTVSGSQICNNLTQQIAIKGDYLIGRNPDDWENGKRYRVLPEHCTLIGNVISTNATGQSLFGLGDDPDDWQSFGCFLKTLKANHNRYSHPSREQAFVNPDGLPTNLEGWQKITGQDKDSVWIRH